MNRWTNLVAGGMLASGMMAMAQTSAPVEKDDLFAGTEKFAQGATSVTQIDMDPDALGKVEGKDGLKARRMLLSVVHTYEYDKPGMYRIEDVEAFRKKLETGDWHCSVHIREMKSGESTDVCSKRRKDELREEAVITVEPKSLTFIHTILRGGSRGGGESGVGMPLQMRMMEPEMKAQMAVARAEMQAQMAMIRPEMMKSFAALKEFKGLDTEQIKGLHESLKNFKGPNPEEMQRLRESHKSLDIE